MVLLFLGPLGPALIVQGIIYFIEERIDKSNQMYTSINNKRNIFIYSSISVPFYLMLIYVIVSSAMNLTQNQIYILHPLFFFLYVTVESIIFVWYSFNLKFKSPFLIILIIPIFIIYPSIMWFMLFFGLLLRTSSIIKKEAISS